ncbi:TRAP transporter substrate-binding protein DctP [Chloroflexota bacterium]
MKTLLCLVFVLVIVIGGISLGCKPAAPPETIEWKYLSSWDHDDIPWVDRVNERAQGRLKIVRAGGSEAVDPRQQLQPLTEGIFDALNSTPSYHAGQVPAGMVGNLLFASAKERRASGLVDTMDEMYQKKANAKLVGDFPMADKYHIFLGKKKIDKADLTGLKIRTTPIYDPLVNELGGASVAVSYAEVYTAMERGVVDGFCFPLSAVMDFKLNEVTEYVVMPGFGEAMTDIYVNLDSWNKLPKDLQDLVMKVTMEMEEEFRLIFAQKYDSDLAEMKRGGVELIELAPSEADKLLTAYYERSWEKLVLQADPVYGPGLKEAADRIVKK